MAKPLLWAAPLFSPAQDAGYNRDAIWYDLLDMREREPIYDLTRKKVTKVELLRDLEGYFGLGLFRTARGIHCCGVRLCFDSRPVKYLSGDQIHFSYAITSLILPTNIVLHGKALRRVLQVPAQRAAANAMGRRVFTKVHPASELPDA